MTGNAFAPSGGELSTWSSTKVSFDGRLIVAPEFEFEALKLLAALIASRSVQSSLPAPWPSSSHAPSSESATLLTAKLGPACGRTSYSYAPTSQCALCGRVT